MRKVIVAAFVSLDGVMQAPGGPQEDPTGGFAFGGWTAPHWDDAVGAFVGACFAHPFELLLGRRTYDIFAAHWPYVPTEPAGDGSFDTANAEIARTFNGTAKHVATHRPDSLVWQNSRALGADVPAAVRALKAQDGPVLVVQGSSDLIQQLLAADLVDEFRLLIYPLVLGHGKRLFGSGTVPGAFTVLKSTVSAKGVLAAAYHRAGAVPTGNFQLEAPTPAELERRRTLGA
jgi:dihydrofolate reductase